MKPEDYPPQESVPEFAREYNKYLLQRAAELGGAEASYGPDPYQSVLWFPAPTPDGNIFIVIHGGGWTSGYKEWMAFMAPVFNQAGIGFVSIGYRLAPTHVFPAGLDDSMSGLRWVYNNVDKLSGDPARLFISGHSAGGHQTSLMAVRKDWQKDYGLPVDVVRGCLPVSGVFDFRESAGLSMRPRFLGPTGNEEAASPICNIQGTPPPFFLSYGSKDFPHLITQAQKMEQALREAGGETISLELHDCDHLQANLVCGDPHGPWADKVIEWIRGH